MTGAGNTTFKGWHASRGSVLLALSGLLIHLALASLWPYRDQAPKFLVGVCLAFLWQLLAHRQLASGGLAAGSLIWISLVLRMAWMAHPPGLSEDLYRYLWDGMLAVEGTNPYPRPPQDMPEFQIRAPELYSQMAHTARTSIYPPLAQCVFAANHWVFGASTLGWRVWLLAAEALLILVWKRSGANAANLALWTLNPLVIIEFYSSGHLDLIALAFLVLSFFLLVTASGSRSWRLLGSASLLGAATLVKLFPAFALPLLVARLGDWRERLRFAIAFLAALVVLCALFLAAWGLPAASWESFAGILDTFRATWRFNSLPFLALQEQQALRPWAERLFVILLLALAWLGWRRGPVSTRDGQTLRALEWERLVTVYYFSMMSLYLFSHTVHPWYVSWGLVAYPILGMRYWAGAYLSGAVFLSYAAYWFQPPGERLWVLWAEYLPFYLLLARDFWKWRARDDSGIVRTGLKTPATLTGA